METTLAFLFGLIIGALVVYLLMHKVRTSDSIAAVVEQRSSEKQNRKERIMDLVQQKGTIANNDVEELLNVSDATATNYLQELEEEGKLKQNGSHGRFVTYQLTNQPSAQST